MKGTRLRWWVEGEPSPRLRTLLSDPDAVLSGPGSVAREAGGRKRLYRLAAAGEEPGLFVKVFSLPRGQRWRYAFRPSKARRESKIARQVVERGFEAAVPLAVGEERRFGILSRSFSVIQELPARDVRAEIRDPELSPERRRALIESFAVFTRQVHDAGIDQDDYSTNNFLVFADGHFALIDFERCSVGKPLRRERGLTLLAKLVRREPCLSTSERVRFLRLYLGANADRQEVHEAIEFILSAFREIRQRDARRAANAAFKLGRHVEHVGEAWVVRTRRDAKCIHFDLPEEQAQEVWIKAHQLERLELPALRPVRLDKSGVSLLDPGQASSLGLTQRSQQRRRARRELEFYGRLNDKTEWIDGADGSLLRNPLAFELSP
ncbi:MAG: hypothetical protein GY725_25655 [bacterium]|nr:hypothetical protein [bacterium]